MQKLRHTCCICISLQVAPQLLSQSEKEEMSHLVDTMIGYGINYKISKNGTSSSNSFMESDGPVFEPPIHKLVQFKVS